MQMSSTITQGVNLFVQLTALTKTPLDLKFMRDEEDLRLALEQVEDSVTSTTRMIGKAMYRSHTTFDLVHDVKRAMEAILLEGADDRETAGLRRRNLNMYHLVIEPVIDQLGLVPHQYAIDNVKAFTRSVYDYAINADINTHEDDAIVAKTIVRGMVKERDDARKAELAARKKSKRSKKKQAELEAEFKEPDVEELVLE